MVAYERLDAWKVCHDLVLAVHRVAESLPESRDGGVIEDLMRAAILAAAKIARGAGTHHRQLFRRCVDLAAGHLGELSYHLRLARDQGILSHAKWQELDALRGRAAFYARKLYLSLGPSPDAGAASDL